MAVHLQRQIESLKQKILFVGTLVEEALAKSVSALVNRDRNLAKTVIDEDAEIDRMEVEVEEEVPQDLGPLSAGGRRPAVRRGGAEDQQRPGADGRPGPQHRQAGACFSCSANGSTCPAIFARWRPRPRPWSSNRSTRWSIPIRRWPAPFARPTTTSINSAATSSRRSSSRSSSSPTQTECLMRLTSVSRHLERIADMATNIAEDVIYMVEGEIVRHNRRAE